MYTRKHAYFNSKIQRFGYSQKRHGSSGAKLKQEIIKVREWIPHIGPLTREIHLNLFLDMVPNSSANFSRALRGQSRRLYTQGHAKLPETKWRQMWEKSPLIRFVDELDFKQIPVSVKKKKERGMSIRTNSNWFKLWIEEGWKFQWRGRWTRWREQQWWGPNIQLLYGKWRNFKKRRGTRERKAEGYNICEEKFQKAKGFKEYPLWRRGRRTMWKAGK